MVKNNNNDMEIWKDIDGYELTISNGVLRWKMPLTHQKAGY
jgi:hypothetical protein